MAQVAVELNEEDNIGARRLRTVVDSVLEDINFEAPDFEEKDSFKSKVQATEDTLKKRHYNRELVT